MSHDLEQRIREIIEERDTTYVHAEEIALNELRIIKSQKGKPLN